MQRKPDFLVIGAARAGTTALYSYLKQHPSIFMPTAKEPNFFAFEGQDLDCKGPGADYINNSRNTLEAYGALFADAPEGALLGEASPLYLFAEQAPRRIHHHIPDVPMVAILRNPIEQAYSHFMYATKQRIEPLESFTEALHQEEARLADGWQPLFGYSSFPRYATQLQRFYDLFPKEQILIRTYEDFQTAPQEVLHDIFAHIGADTAFVPDMSHRPNAGGVPKNRLFQDFLMKPNPITRAIGLVVPQEARLKIRDQLARLNLKGDTEMPKEARIILIERLAAEIHAVQRLIGRDLSHWLR